MPKDYIWLEVHIELLYSHILVLMKMKQDEYILFNIEEDSVDRTYSSYEEANEALINMNYQMLNGRYIKN